MNVLAMVCIKYVSIRRAGMQGVGKLRAMRMRPPYPIESPKYMQSNYTRPILSRHSVVHALYLAKTHGLIMKCDSYPSSLYIQKYIMQYIPASILRFQSRAIKHHIQKSTARAHCLMSPHYHNRNRTWACA